MNLGMSMWLKVIIDLLPKITFSIADKEFQNLLEHHPLHVNFIKFPSEVYISALQNIETGSNACHFLRLILKR